MEPVSATITAIVLIATALIPILADKLIIPAIREWRNPKAEITRRHKRAAQHEAKAKKIEEKIKP